MPKPAPPFPCVGDGDKARVVFWNLLWDLLTRSPNQPPRLPAATEVPWARGCLGRWGREVPGAAGERRGQRPRAPCGGWGLQQRAPPGMHSHAFRRLTV